MQRLALAYCPKPARRATLALFALDTKLAGILRHSSEPALAQLRLAWWREVLGQSSAGWPAGEPLLAAAREWDGEREALRGLVDGWEEMTGAAPLPSQAIGALADARARALAALARLVGADRDAGDADRMGRAWALVDIASHLSDPRERETALELARAHEWRASRLSRPLRPLVVLHGLARRGLTRGESLDALPPAAIASAARLGLLGL